MSRLLLRNLQGFILLIRGICVWTWFWRVDLVLDIGMDDFDGSGFINAHHANEALQRMDHFLRNKQLCDVTLVGTVTDLK